MLTHRDLRFAIKSTDDRGRVSGLASVYGNVDSYGDVVMPGAFAATLRKNGGRRVVLWQHDPAEPIGLATLTDSAKGLHCDIRLELGITKARDCYAAVKAGLINGISIGYMTEVERMSRDGARELHAIDLMEISIVTFPANDAARISEVRARATDPQTLAEVRALANDLAALRMTAELRQLTNALRASLKGNR